VVAPAFNRGYLGGGGPEVEIRMMEIQGQPGQKVLKTLSQPTAECDGPRYVGRINRRTAVQPAWTSM
jgi:hypothetical protein